MSVQGDIRIEAAAAAHARKRGPPLGPRVKHRFIRDEDGTLVRVYPGLACAAPGCAVVELTSKNRHGTKTLCLQHGREEDRNRVRGPRAPRSSSAKPGSKPSSTSTTPAEMADPKKERLLALFRSFLAHPTVESTREVLIEEMDRHELIARLRRVIPPAATVAPIGPIPVEDPSDDLTNPNHRSTRSEFLSDADQYGA